MEKEPPKDKITTRSYWIVFILGILYILLLGLFTLLFNNPA